MQGDVENEAQKATRLQLLTKKEVAGMLACSVRMVERLVASGQLTAVKIRGAVRFRLGDVEQIEMNGAA